MKLVTKKLLLAAAITGLLTGCDSGGITIAPETNDNSVDNSTGGGDGGAVANNPCASYEKAGSVKQGEFNSETGNCTYNAAFVDSGNPLTVDLVIPALENGAHLFEGSLFVGNNYDDDTTMAAAGIAEGGDGAQLTVQAGATVAFPDSTKFMVVNRGSQLVAVGTAQDPITFTSLSDVEGTVGPEDIQQWGGMVINGFGITNKCAYDAEMNTSECHVLAEGAAGKDQSNYGGDNNGDSSGHMEYVRVKHTGAEVANGDELNGITFSSVGSGTIVKNLQVYSTYDDGIEMFGGAVSFENYLAMYVRDDSIDIDEGWSGSITNALVIQSETDGNHCIESDGIGSYKDTNDYTALIAAGLNSRPVIDGLTCIISAQSEGTHDPGAGWRFREGIYPMITNSMVIGSFAADENGVEGSNYCLRVESAETTAALAAGTEASITSNIFACADKTKGGPIGTDELEAWAVANGNVFADVPADAALNPTAAADTGLQLLEGPLSVFSIDTDSMMVNDAAVGISPIERAYLGALSAGDSDWTVGWTYGLHDGSRAQALWFEQQ
ncbi:serine/threonine protein kinase [Microbulbifer agarilyticus]|uniref:serine/threonine protein kinase n=1 Tax=Microbulbifer agarilyticus TaxID=260552 RepID=UPI001C98C336|nr:serine/threonine protein kinase [Microbulbifer agarilyticus]MBY6189291.1 serine/threonine protein kinase [Microbulbifer agarilyticus]MBY6212385.1 serine/threonine protein kinase [Microbulbifer agarilyticus]